jgi:hypothetical protein
VDEEGAAREALSSLPPLSPVDESEARLAAQVLGMRATCY